MVVRPSTARIGEVLFVDPCFRLTQRHMALPRILMLARRNLAGRTREVNRFIARFGTYASTRHDFGSTATYLDLNLAEFADILRIVCERVLGTQNRGNALQRLLQVALGVRE